MLVEIELARLAELIMYLISTYARHRGNAGRRRLLKLILCVEQATYAGGFSNKKSLTFEF